MNKTNVRLLMTALMVAAMALILAAGCGGSSDGGEQVLGESENADEPGDHADNAEDAENAGSTDEVDGVSAGDDASAAGNELPPMTTTTLRPELDEPPVLADDLPDPLPEPTEANPFPPLPADSDEAVVVTSNNIVAPIVRSISDGHFVRTPCSNQRLLFNNRTLSRAHVVLDAGHGGREIGAVGSAGVREKDINLIVVNKTKELLEAQGATVVRTRTDDYSVTTQARGEIATRLAPYLFVSVHHNGGAPANDDRPGTIVFTKANNPDATRFGGIFHQNLNKFLLAKAAETQAVYDDYMTQRDAHQAAQEAYDAAVAAQNAAPAPEGVDPAAGGETNTTIQATPRPADANGPVLGPDGQPLTPPEPFDLEVPAPFNADTENLQFKFAGAGNSGVRSWIRDDGEDFLGVLRNTQGVPAVLAEFLYVTNPIEEALLADPEFLDAEAFILAQSIVEFLTTNNPGDGHVRDQFGDQNIGGGGRPSDCNESL